MDSGNQFKDYVSQMCLAGTVVAFWSLTQEMAGSNPFTVMTNIFVTEFSEFSENSIPLFSHHIRCVEIIPSVSPQRLSKQRLFKDTRLRFIIDVSCRESSRRKDGDEHSCSQTIHICNAEAC